MILGAMTIPHPSMPAQRSILGAGIVVLGLVVGASEVRADAIGVFDPVASEVCGGSYHEPNCSPTALGSGACALFSLALVGVVFAFRGRRERH